jgi:hypothetical protein
MKTSPSRSSRDDGFGRSTRFYDLPSGERYPSVTSILSAVNKPALINWAAKTERELVTQAAANLWEDARGTSMSREAFLASLATRIPKQKAYVREVQKAADIGTQAHALIEWNMRKELGQEVGPEPRVSDKALWAFMAYEEWRKTAGLKATLIEQIVWSSQYGYAGTLDWYGDIDHKGQRLVVVGDWKTGKAIYGEAILQAAAYGAALQEMGHSANGVAGCIVRLPKIETDPEFEVRVIPAEEMREKFQVFLHVLEVWKWMEKAA